MRVLVCGSRSLTGKIVENAVYQRLADLPRPTEVLHGGADGPDIFAYWAAIDLGHIGRTFLPDWKTHGKRAGLVRNVAMLDEKPDLVIAFWDGESRGTAHTVREARKRGIAVDVVSVRAGRQHGDERDET